MLIPYITQMTPKGNNYFQSLIRKHAIICRITWWPSIYFGNRTTIQNNKQNNDLYFAVRSEVYYTGDIIAFNYLTNTAEINDYNYNGNNVTQVFPHMRISSVGYLYRVDYYASFIELFKLSIWR
jgi:hypothetical protein